MDIQNEIKVLLEKLEVVLKLADEGLLKSERYYETKCAIEDRLKELSPNLDEQSQLTIEKNIPHWRNVPKSGIFMDASKVTDILPLRALLLELLEKFSYESPRQIKKEIGQH